MSALEFSVFVKVLCASNTPGTFSRKTAGENLDQFRANIDIWLTLAASLETSTSPSCFIDGPRGKQLTLNASVE